MRDNFKKFIWGTLVLIILVLAYKLRANNYDKVPLPGVSMDEYSYAWVGMSLLDSGYPIGISGIEGYQNLKLDYINVDDVYSGQAGGNPLKINYPWFDHPPAMPLLTGGYAWLKGARSFEEARIFLIRKPMLWLSLVTTLALVWLAYLEFGYLASIITGLVWAVVPAVVVSSRMVQAENGVIACWLVSLVGLSWWRKKKNNWLLTVSALFAGMACLFKLSGVVAIISGGLWIMLSNYQKRRWVDLFFWVGVSGLVMSLFLVYGLLIDAGQFVTILLTNSQRFYGIGAGAMFNLLRESKLTNVKFMTDAWLTVGWISTFWWLLRQKMGVINLGVVSYVGIYLLFGSYGYGWYTFPFWPFLILSFSALVARVWTKGKGVEAVLLMLVAVGGYYLTKFVDIIEFQRYAGWWRYGLAILIFGLLGLRVVKSKYYRYLSMALVMVVLGWCCCLSIKFNALVDISYWYQLN